MVLKVIKVHKYRGDPQARQVLKVKTVLKVLKVRKDLVDPRAQQALKVM